MKARAFFGGAMMLALVSAAPLTAQQRGGMRGQGPMAMSPVAFLLDQADSLNLTADQTTKAMALKDSLDAANAPHVKELEDLRASGGGGGGFQQMRPVMEKIRTNNDAYLDKVMALLQPEQQTVAKRILDRMPQRRRGGGGR